MAIFSHPLWGYECTYPNDWIHQTSGDIEAFAALKDALNTEYAGPQAGHVAVRCEFNHTGESIDPLWNEYISKLSIMLGAKQIGSAPLSMGGGKGYEAEIIMPKKNNKRLWTGILSYGLTIMHLMATHPLDLREWFEPLATRIVTSLRFISHVSDLPTTNDEIPLPPNYNTTDPTTILQDIKKEQNWLAYTGNATVAALQAFYVRELPKFNWEIDEFTPYPNQDKLRFARLIAKKEARTASLGIIPKAGEEINSTVVIKL
jgi:hypothetical protein